LELLAAQDDLLPTQYPQDSCLEEENQVMSVQLRGQRNPPIETRDIPDLTKPSAVEAEMRKASTPTDFPQGIFFDNHSLIVGTPGVSERISVQPDASSFDA
jgi:hypothetical protein